MDSNRIKPDEEEELLRACKEGLPGARERLIRRFQPIVESHVIHLLRRYKCSHLVSEHLNEIAQLIWTEFFARVEKFPAGEFGKWFSFLRRWKTLDYIRKELTYRTRNTALRQNYPPACSWSLPVSNPEEKCYTKQLRTEILICLSEMPSREREFLWLYYYRGWSYEQIAEKFGISSGAVGSLRTRAMRKLKYLLDK